LFPKQFVTSPTPQNKSKKKLKIKIKQRNKRHEIKNKKNGNKKKEKNLLKKYKFLIFDFRQSQFLQEGMQRGSTRFFNE